MAKISNSTIDCCTLPTTKVHPWNIPYPMEYGPPSTSSISYSTSYILDTIIPASTAPPSSLCAFTTLPISFFSDYLFLSLPTSCSGHLELRFYLFRHFRFTLNFLYCTAPSSVSLGGQGEQRSQQSIVARIDIWVSSMSDDSWILNVG